MSLAADVEATLNHWLAMNDPDKELTKWRRLIASEIRLAAEDPAVSDENLPLLSNGGSFLVARIRRRWYVLHVASSRALDSPKTRPPPKSRLQAERRAASYESLHVDGAKVDWGLRETSERLLSDPALLRGISTSRADSDLNGIRLEEAAKQRPVLRGARFPSISAARDYYLGGGDESFPDHQRNWMKATGRRNDIALSADGSFLIVPLNRKDYDYFSAVPVGSGLLLETLTHVNHKSKMNELLKVLLSSFVRPDGQPFDWAATDLKAEVDRWNEQGPLDFETRLVKVRAEFDRQQGYANSAAIAMDALAKAAAPEVMDDDGVPMLF